MISHSIPEAIRQAIGSEEAALHEPCFAGNESEYLQDCINSTYVSSVGEFVDRFEGKIAALTGAEHVVAVVNGTAALHGALIVAGVKAGDEVIVPALTFVATANAVCYCGAAPHFVDSNEQTLGMDPSSLREHLSSVSVIRNGQCVNRETGAVVRAVVPTHIFGHPCEMHELLEIAKDFSLVVVEDAAESLGSWYQNRHTGTFGKLGVLSFNGNKIITTGGGGAILTNDPDLARKAKHLTTTAKVPHCWEYTHDAIGYNYRMPNLNAALGCAQLEQLPDFLRSKRRLTELYKVAFNGVERVRLFEEPAQARSNYWLQTLILDESAADERDAVLKATNDAGLMTRPAWELIPRLKPFRNCPHGPLPVSESIVSRICNIPSSAHLA